ncbi:winged helix-turn-helix transcriptional regulator [Mangrovicoccus algicola]|uniref:Helix-turn-helix transcriptional regulator n=1 Tax=Mangrovicoccus algicola TaxID=2771008 RepID=A0A8J6YYP7_9RHOB|nr:helix-turn-helix domain-containing protein [Mangrovicoccus algicola]MBE3638451.1 helix-turn-helix transcriptional regulator [Mangrovicoccus algicola]
MPDPDLRRELRALPETDPAIDRLVEQIIGRVADKWTMLLIEILTEHDCCRFGELARLCPGISQKMLTQTLRALECDGLVTRTVYPVVPPRVEYRLTDLGLGLAKAFCGVWLWAEANRERIEAARAAYAAGRDPVTPPGS